MRRIINGKVYDTATATEVANISTGSHSRSDFRYEDTHLYRSPKGQWFIAGYGGARSRWAHPINNGTTNGNGLELIGKEDAQELVERHRPEVFADYFGEPAIG